MKLQDILSCRCNTPVHVPFSISWSDDNYVVMATEEGIQCAGGRRRTRNLLLSQTYTMGILLLMCFLHCAASTDITSNVFGSSTSMMPAGFGDFNSDEYPDLFVIRDNHQTIEILLGGDAEPLIRTSGTNGNLKCKFPGVKITSVVPGDFDGDAIMDVMITVDSPTGKLGCDDNVVQEVKVLWGSGDSLDCKSKFGKEPILMCGQPLAMDWNNDMIIDLFGEVNKIPTFWVFNPNRTYPTKHPVETNEHSRLRIPHSHAFLDLNGDYNPDMFVTTEDGFQVWLKSPGQPESFSFSHETTKFPNVAHKGQSIFLDTELKGKLDHIFPGCYSEDCTNSSIFVFVNNHWLDLKINFHDKSNNIWGFVKPNPDSLIQNVITLHGGDYNMDGFPDLLATLRHGNRQKTFLLKNELCVADCTEYGRTFTVAWNEFSPMNNNTQLGVFYDFMQDGILDIIFFKEGNVSAFKNNLDYDANFIKVMVITGIKDQKQRVIPDPIGRKNRTYGTNLPGPLISYNSTDQDDEARASVSAQLPQSAYFSLNLPYTLFGLGRTPNFVDKLTIGVYGKTRDWTQIIPNSQMVVIPIPQNEPSRWMARLFVTPSKLIVKSFIALLGTCLLLTMIIVVLWWKERREDHQERRQESHRFHYDAM